MRSGATRSPASAARRMASDHGDILHGLVGRVVVRRAVAHGGGEGREFLTNSAVRAPSAGALPVATEMTPAEMRKAPRPR